MPGQSSGPAVWPRERILTPSRDEPPMFEVGHRDLEITNQKGYCWTTNYGNETELRELLQSCGVPDAEIDLLFERAKL